MPKQQLTKKNDSHQAISVYKTVGIGPWRPPLKGPYGKFVLITGVHRALEFAKLTQSKEKKCPS